VDVSLLIPQDLKEAWFGLVHALPPLDTWAPVPAQRWARAALPAVIALREGGLALRAVDYAAVRGAPLPRPAFPLVLASDK